MSSSNMSDSVEESETHHIIRQYKDPRTVMEKKRCSKKKSIDSVVSDVDGEDFEAYIGKLNTEVFYSIEISYYFGLVRAI